MEERPKEVPLPNFVRCCADEWKALYFEGRRVRDRLEASEDSRWKAAAFGVAR
jgi:hypothetical protein